jgi:hypothetical protein
MNAMGNQISENLKYEYKKKMYYLGKQYSIVSVYNKQQWRVLYSRKWRSVMR